MKKIILCSAFGVALSSPMYALETPDTYPDTTTPVTAPPVTAPANDIPVLETPEVQNTAQPAQTLNCEFKIPAKTAVEQSTVADWSKNATMQAFTYTADSVDAQLESLKKCFTDQGWQGFNSALQQSGNLAAIKSQHLNVSSMVTGAPTFVESRDNQWQLTMPVQVVYQNDKQKITQDLKVTLMVGRKPSGELGILQMVAVPGAQEQPATAPAAPVETTP